jgi:16S rRNA (uracil1498-N3)-methyltransferase
VGDDRAPPPRLVTAEARPLLRVPVTPLAPGRATLDAETARYVTRVHRLGAGDAILAFDPTRAVEAVATIVEAASRVTIDVGDVARSTHLPPREVTLFQGIPKGGKIDDIVRDATELGVTRVVLVACARSQGGPAPRADRLARVALEAARQCGRGDVPEIIGPVVFDALADATGTRVALVPEATRSFAAILPEEADVVSILVGPEGGLDAREITALGEWSFGLVRLGPFVMRTETAAAAALGAFWSRFGDVSGRPAAGAKKAL